MTKKASGQNPVDEAYLRSLMAGVSPEPAESPSVTMGTGNEKNGVSGEKKNMDSCVNETMGDIPEADNTFHTGTVMEKPSPRTIRTALADFTRRFLTPYKCEGRQGVYIDKELHQKISVIVGIAGKRQLTVGNYIDNVLKEHFERHSEEVKAHLQKSYNKIF